MRTREALAGLASMVAMSAAGCAATRPLALGPQPPAAPEASVTPAVAPSPNAGRKVALAVHDPTDLEARLAIDLRTALAARGVEAVLVGPKGGEPRGLVVDVFVLNRQRSDERVQLHELGSRTASGFGLATGTDDPSRLPEVHAAALESYDFGRGFRQTDLRMIVTASLRQAGVARPLARWSDQEGALLRAGDGGEPAVNPWAAVYGAVAEQLAEQIVGVLGRTRAADGRAR
jgi:hypothetical protein